MPISSRPPPAWAQSTARGTWVRFFPNSARATRRSPSVPWARADLRASTAGKNRVQMACRPQKEESRTKKGKERVKTQELTTQVFSLFGPILERVPAGPQSNKNPLPSFHSLSVSKLCPAPDSLPSPLLSTPTSLTLALSFLIYTITPASQFYGLNCVPTKFMLRS